MPAAIPSQLAVSVVVPVYNPGPHIEPCIESLLAQSMPSDRYELIFVDDGSSTRSLATQLAASTNAPVAKADAIIDATPSAADIDAALTQLEATARSRGIALGTASTLPVTVDRIAQWAKTLEQRGITLVPVSAVAVKPKSS